MRTFFLLIVLLVTALSATSLAQALSPEVEAAAREAFAEGERQFDAGNHQLALDAFQRMHDLMTADPGAQAMVSYNIALCLDRLGRLEEALDTYERFLEETPADAPYRQRAGDRVRELRGRAELRARSEGSNGDAPAEPTPEASASPIGPFGIALSSVGAALLIAALPTGVLALDGEAHLAAACPGGACPAEERARIDEARTLGIATDVLWVSGAVLGAAGISLLLFGLVSDRDASETASITPAILCGEQGCMAAVTGSF